MMPTPYYHGGYYAPPVGGGPHYKKPQLIDSSIVAVVFIVVVIAVAVVMYISSRYSLKEGLDGDGTQEGNVTVVVEQAPPAAALMDLNPCPAPYQASLSEDGKQIMCSIPMQPAPQELSLVTYPVTGMLPDTPQNRSLILNNKDKLACKYGFVPDMTTGQGFGLECDPAIVGPQDNALTYIAFDADEYNKQVEAGWGKFAVATQ